MITTQWRAARLFLPAILGLALVLVLLALFGVSPSAKSASDRLVCASGCPYTSVQAAVDAAAQGDVIKVATGTYTGIVARPRNDISGSGLVTQVVYLSKTLTIRGGYAPGQWDVSDPDANPTILDAQGRGRVLYIAGDVSPMVEGLRLTGGDATGLGGHSLNRDAGGGVYVVTATATLSHNRIFSNTANLGGGVYLQASAATLSRNQIISNTASDGGGLYADHSAAVLNYNSIATNSADSEGGGLFLEQSPATLNGNTIRDSFAGFNGGGLFVSQSAASLTNNVLADNRAEQRGSGLFIWSSSPHLAHTTLARNAGGDGSGVHVANNSAAALTNTILVSHTVGITVASTGKAVLDATLWGDGRWANEAPWGGAGEVVTGTENVWKDPAFVNPAAGDYHLAPGSAAIDEGIDVDVDKDIDGERRPVDGNEDGLAEYDLGADEVGFRVYLPLLQKGG